jgi:ribosomal protein L11 methyltransferase
MACGTGRHPATQLCLEAMERYVQPGSTVLDVGTGSGILSAAAQLLGAARVFACDIDAGAVAIARRRVTAAFFAGSIDAVASGTADVIVANINSETIERLRPEFERVRRHGGTQSTLILSGFPEWDSLQGFAVSETLRREEWVCVVCGGVRRAEFEVR